MWHFILLLQYFNHIRLYKNSKPTLLPLSHGLVCREKLPVSRPSSSWTQEHISVYTIILINSYRLAVEYTYLLRRPVSTGSNKQTTANTQITAWVSLWLTLLTSWFVFTLVLKNYRKMWNTFPQKQSAVYWSVTVTNNISLSMQVSSQVSS